MISYGLVWVEGLPASEILQFSPQVAGHSEALLKCIYANAYSMRNKEKLEVLAQFQSYDICGISKNLVGRVLWLAWVCYNGC